MANLTADRLKQFLTYHPTTGVFTRNVASGGMKVGERVGCVEGNGYVHICVDGTSYKAHRLAWLYTYGEWPSRVIDHKDGCPEHNWITNLRVVTIAQNKANQKVYRNNTSGHKGVSFYRPRGKWLAKIGADGRRIHLGYFSTFEEAVEAYNLASEKYHGEFARAA